MSGKIVAIGLVVIALLFGAGLWYSLEYAYYRKVELGPGLVMTLEPQSGGAPAMLTVSHFRGIDASSSPIRFRACFNVATPLPELVARYAPYSGAVPLNGPHWFSCFDADEIGHALAAGKAKAFLAAKGVAPEVDRVIAVFPDGRGYAWQQIDPAAPKDSSMME